MISLLVCFWSSSDLKFFLSFLISFFFLLFDLFLLFLMLLLSFFLSFFRSIIIHTVYRNKVFKFNIVRGITKLNRIRDSCIFYLSNRASNQDTTCFSTFHFHSKHVNALKSVLLKPV